MSPVELTDGRVAGGGGGGAIYDGEKASSSMRCNQIVVSLLGSAHMLIISPIHHGNIVRSAGISRSNAPLLERKLSHVQGSLIHCVNVRTTYQVPPTNSTTA